MCRDVERSVAFYQDILGFTPVSAHAVRRATGATALQPPLRRRKRSRTTAGQVKRPATFNETFAGSWLHGYGIGLHLIKGEPVTRSSHIDPKSDHLSFQADSLEDVAAQLAACGVPFVRQMVVEDGIAVTQLFFADPDRNMIEVGASSAWAAAGAAAARGVWAPTMLRCAVQVCDCHCLPIVPLDVAAPACTVGHACVSNACGQQHPVCNGSHSHEDDEMSSDGTRDSLDSSHSGWTSMSSEATRAVV